MPFTADNKDAFRKYKGIEVLIEMLKGYKSDVVARALTHVLTGNSNPNFYFIFFNFVSQALA